MRIRRKTQKCLNCGHTLGEVYNYCPNCGQENNDHNVSLGTLLGEFFSNYFGVDGRFLLTFKHFFTKPGFLTNQYNMGRRKAYVNPVRQYLVMSLIYFFVLGLVGNRLGSWQQVLANAGDNDITFQSDKKANYSLMIDSLPPTTFNLNETLDSISKATGTEVKLDSTIRLDTLIDLDSLDPIDTTINPKSGLRQTMLAMRDLEKPDSVVQKELNLESMGTREFHQLRKITQSEVSIFVGSTIQNIPVMMFFMIPLFALLLRLWYMRRKFMYIQHLIHGLHLHSFAYIVFSLATIAMLYFTQLSSVRAIIALVAFVIVSTYAYISFLRVYKQKWFKTLLKFWLQGFTYAMVLAISASIALIATFYLY